ncbi:MAG: peptidoglycan-associated lipoprotein Pal [Hyphomicrobiaceae bacterium]|nr:peptidoglycan-associated lipoprotein Pal [Hyphomicrobiaceae bacterium]
MTDFYKLRKDIAITVACLVLTFIPACSHNELEFELVQFADRKPQAISSKRYFTEHIGDVIYFATNSSHITQESQTILARQAIWLNKHNKYFIKIEGHADERGTREYNIALGARRAVAVQNFLTQSGVDPRRIHTVTLGKERPTAVCNDILCWSQNRRVKVVLKQNINL